MDVAKEHRDDQETQKYPSSWGTRESPIAGGGRGHNGNLRSFHFRPDGQIQVVILPSQLSKV
jgi:hypothetical protein